MLLAIEAAEDQQPFIDPMDCFRGPQALPLPEEFSWLKLSKALEPRQHLEAMASEDFRHVQGPLAVPPIGSQQPRLLSSTSTYQQAEPETLSKASLHPPA